MRKRSRFFGTSSVFPFATARVGFGPLFVESADPWTKTFRFDCFVVVFFAEEEEDEENNTFAVDVIIFSFANLLKFGDKARAREKK
jgi:hypothetical protein